jgi:hypothetical protein
MANISELLINAVTLNEPKEVDQAQAKKAMQADNPVAHWIVQTTKPAGE